MIGIAGPVGSAMALIPQIIGSDIQAPVKACKMPGSNLIQW
jgi:hypothetical protein